MEIWGGGRRGPGRNHHCKQPIMDSLSSKELSKRQIEGVQIAAPYGRLMGEIETKAIILIWGENGSGKSTLALGMADAMAAHGRVEYVPSEENFGKTLIDRINRLKATHENLHMTEYKSLDALKAWVEANEPICVFLDSISVLNANDKKVVDFAGWCRSRGVGFVMISHANKDNSYKGNSMLAHETDINIEVIKDNNTARTTKNRYLGELRSISVPFQADDLEDGRHASNEEQPKKDDQEGNPSNEDTDFTSQMEEVEQLMADV